MPPVDGAWGEVKLLCLLPSHSICLVQGLRKADLRAVVDLNLVRIFDIVTTILILHELLIHSQVLHSGGFINQVNVRLLLFLGIIVYIRFCL
jgi:hypothetical protein